MRALILCCLLAVTVDDPAIEAYAKALREGRAKRSEELRKEVETLQRTLATQKSSDRKNPIVQFKRLAELKKESKALIAGELVKFPVRIDPYELELGRIGVFRASKRVKQLDPDTLPPFRTLMVDAKNLHVQSLVDDTSFLAVCKTSYGISDPVMLTNIETKGLRTGKSLRVFKDTLFYIDKTTDYVTVTGAKKTVFVARRVEISDKDLEPYFKADPDKKKTTTKTTEPSASDAQKAEAKLKLVKRIVDKNKDLANKWLAEIIEKYPTTSSAKEARELLEDLK